jgi:predicted transcriptional regulator YdeE
MSESINIKPFKVYGIQDTGPSTFNHDSKAGADFSSKLWHEFIDKVLSSGVALDQDMYGISWPADDQTPPQQVTYFCGFKSDFDVYGFESLQIDGGNFFEYRYEGYVVDIVEGFHDAYMQAFPSSGLKPRAGQHIEIYGDEYDPDSPISIFKIMIPTE